MLRYPAYMKEWETKVIAMSYNQEKRNSIFSILFSCLTYILDRFCSNEHHSVFCWGDGMFFMPSFDGDIIYLGKLTNNPKYFIYIYIHTHKDTVMCYLMTRIDLRNALVGDFVIIQISECTYTELGGMSYYTPRLYVHQ